MPLNGAKGRGHASITEEEINKLIEIGLITREEIEKAKSGVKEESLVAKTLEVCRILYNNGVDLRRLKVSKKIDGKNIMLLLSEIEQDGIDIKRIIEENGLDGEFKLGSSVKTLRGAYNAEKAGKKHISPITKEEMQEAEKIGLVQEEKEKSIVAKTLEVCKVLYNNGVDLSRLKVSRKIDGKDIMFLLSEIEQDRIDIKRIIEENGLDGSFAFGYAIKTLRGTYNAEKAGKKHSSPITKEEMKESERIGIVQEEKSIVAKTLEVCEVLYNNGVDLSRLKITKMVDGKQVHLLLSEIKQDGIDIKRIIKDNELDEDFNFGFSITTLRRSYNKEKSEKKAHSPITKEEMEEAERIGLVDVKREDLKKMIEEDKERIGKVEEAKQLEGMYEKQLEEKDKKNKKSTNDGHGEQ